MLVDAQIINAFVDNNAGGNPAGVVFDADQLSNEQKLKIASLIGVSETAFISRSEVADFKLDFFTPVRQIAHCGHATVATFSYLNQVGKIGTGHFTKETIDGTREILVEGALAFMEQKAPKYLDPGKDIINILNSLGLNEEDVPKETPITIVNTGNSYAILPVIDEERLRNIKPDFDLITKISDEYDLIGYYVFYKTSGTRDAETRMFAPRYGIKEEAGTGMAAGPLACYLFDVLNIKKETFHISQGRYMATPSPSLIIVNLTIEDSLIKKLMAGGKGISIRKISVEI